MTNIPQKHKENLFSPMNLDHLIYFSNNFVYSIKDIHIKIEKLIWFVFFLRLFFFFFGKEFFFFFFIFLWPYFTFFFSRLFLSNFQILIWMLYFVILFPKTFFVENKASYFKKKWIIDQHTPKAQRKFVFTYELGPTT